MSGRSDKAADSSSLSDGLVIGTEENDDDLQIHPGVWGGRRARRWAWAKA
jgi:hypothetical protein